MKKRIIIAVAFTACLALCAAVWPQAETVGETPAAPQTPAVTAQGPTVAGSRNRPANREKKGWNSAAGASP